MGVTGDTTDAGLPRLGSWTRTMNEAEGMQLLDLAEDGLRVADWAAIAHDELPFPKADRRNDHIRLVRRTLLDLDADEADPDARIVASPYLLAFQSGNGRRRRDLLWGRFALDRPWCLRAMQALVLPALAEADEPLAARDADLVPAPAWDAFVDQNVLPTGDVARRKTVTEIHRLLDRLGSLQKVGGNTHYETRARHARPDPLAFAHLVVLQMRRDARTEAPETWFLHQSEPALLFAVSEAESRRAIELGVEHGLFARSTLAGVPRLRLPSMGEG